MVITYEVPLPTYEELECPELPFGSHLLKAGGSYLGSYCNDINNEFMLCRNEQGFHKCVNEGKLVTKCTFEFFSQLKKFCPLQLDRYANCLDKSTFSYDARSCTKTKTAFEDCVFENLHMKKNDIAEHARAKIYTGSRPAPEPEIQIFDGTPIGEEDDPDGMPEMKRGNFQFRAYFFK